MLVQFDDGIPISRWARKDPAGCFGSDPLLLK
jgi:hypothetical protein